MAHHGHGGGLTAPAPVSFPGGVTTLLGILALGGFAAFFAGLASDPTRAWASFVSGHFYFMSLAVGGLFFAAIQWLTSAMWSAPVRRLAEAYTAYLPVALVGVVALYFGMHSLYIWSDMHHVQGDLVLEGKSGYLATGFFMIRNIVAVLLWIAFGRLLVGSSLAQDKDRPRDFSINIRNRGVAAVFLLFFAVSFTVAAFDQIMSLDPHWFSTIFGVYCFAGMFYSTLALTAILAIYLRKLGPLKDFVNDNHLHDLGKFMFAFTVFWAYIGFSQFMLIWYANMPEETGYYIDRFAGGWAWVSAFLLVGKFMVPFFFLLPRDAKRNEARLVGVGFWMLFCQWIDVIWMVQPQFYKDGPHIGWMEIGTFVGFAGVFGIMVTRFLSRHVPVAIGDPRLEESVNHHHQ